MKRIISTIVFVALMISSCGGDHEHGSSGDSTPSTHHMHGMEGMDDMEGMDHGHADHSNMIVLNEREQLLAGIVVDSVRYNDFKESITALGIVSVSENTVSVITAKVDGRIERLIARNEGADIARGEPLMEIYSETILAEEQDLVHFIRNNASPDLINATKQKLKLHGLTDGQISNIEKRQIASAYFTIYSNAGGFLSALNVREGQYVETGNVLVEIASLDDVRINAQVYPGEIESFTKASKFIIDGVGESDTSLTATLLLDNPALEPSSKIYNMRLKVSNPGHTLRPGMMVTVHAVSRVKKLLTIPRNSLLFEKGMWLTWVQEPDGMFNRRMVRIGKQNGDLVEITEGIAAGERIVVSGIYLLNSEFVLRKGANTMAGMEM